MAKTVSDKLRTALVSSKESRYQIAKATGISQSILSRFVHKESGLSMEYMDRLAAHLNLKLVPAPKRRKKGI